MSLIYSVSVYPLAFEPPFYQRCKLFFRTVSIFCTLVLRDQDFIAIAVFPFIGVIKFEYPVVISIVHGCHQDNSTLFYHCQTIFCCIFISDRICTVCLIAFLNQIAIFIVAVGRSRIVPYLCIGPLDELVGIVVLIVIFYFADTIFDLLVRGPVSNLVISIIMNRLFTALCFFRTACQFPVVIILISTCCLDLFLRMLTVCFVCLFPCIAPVIPVFPAWRLSSSGFQFGRCLADYISLIIVFVLISADYFATGTTGIHNLCDMIFCIVRHFRLCSIASNDFCHTIQRIMLVCRHLSVTVCQFYQIII